MTEYPILFTVPMVQAILDGRKSVTRRVVTVPWKGSVRTLPYSPYWLVEDGKLLFMNVNDGGEFKPTRSPYGAPGDRLWVRESWGLHLYHDFTCWNRDSLAQRSKEEILSVWELAYRADAESPYDHWRPNIHMPRWAARLMLEVVSIRVERLHEVTDEEALLEGVEPDRAHGLGHPDDADSARERYRALWDAINSGRGYGWNVNPWVWRIEFKRLAREVTP